MHNKEKAMATFQNRSKFWTKRRSEIAIGYLLILPAFAILLLFIGYPLYRSVQLSFNELYLLKGIDSEHFVGLKQYIKLFNEPKLGEYLKNQLFWVSGSAILPIIAGLIFALFLHRPMKFRWLYRGIALIPWATPLVAAAMAWQWLLNKEWGIINYYLVEFGLVQESIGFLTRPGWIWLSIIVMTIWYWFPFNYVSILAVLQGIPTELYDAAKVDGASGWQTIWLITFPILRPMLSTLLVLGIIWGMNDFATIWVLTRGGPGTYTTTLAPLVYRTSFEFGRLGYGAAIGVVLMLLSLIVVIYYVRSVRFEE
jgi:multiple sugar transport system permease protein